MPPKDCCSNCYRLDTQLASTRRALEYRCLDNPHIRKSAGRVIEGTRLLVHKCREWTPPPESETDWKAVEEKVKARHREEYAIQTGKGKGGAMTLLIRSLGSTQPATPAQIGYIYVVGREAGMARDEIEEECQDEYDKQPDELSKAEASAFIRSLKDEEE